MIAFRDRSKFRADRKAQRVLRHLHRAPVVRDHLPHKIPVDIVFGAGPLHIPEHPSGDLLKTALLPAASNGETSRYGVLLVYKKKAVGAYLLEKPSGTVLGLQDAQNELAKQTSGEDYSGDWGERHDEQLTDSTAQQTSGEPETAPEAAPQAAPYTELPLDAEGYPVE